MLGGSGYDVVGTERKRKQECFRFGHFFYFVKRTSDWTAIGDTEKKISEKSNAYTISHRKIRSDRENVDHTRIDLNDYCNVKNITFRDFSFELLRYVVLLEIILVTTRMVKIQIENLKECKM